MSFQADPGLGTLRADGDALRRAAMNLVENALRHSGQSSVAIHITQSAVEGFVIRVEDSGCGVPDARLEALFEPFERVEDANSDQSCAAGTGLGLAIVREIALSHGGDVLAENRSPQGFGVEIRIPSSPVADSPGAGDDSAVDPLAENPEKVSPS